MVNFQHDKRQRQTYLAGGISDGCDLQLLLCWLDREQFACELLSLAALFGSGIALLWLCGVAWEYNQLGHVCLKALYVHVATLNLKFVRPVCTQKPETLPSGSCGGGLLQFR